jgi:isoleucyl-tRNA synthetase
VLDAHGADAVRWYFLSQVQPWTNTRFGVNRVGDAKKDFLIRLQNVWSFFNIYARIDGFDPAEGNPGATGCDPSDLKASKTYVAATDRSLMDRWILSELHTTVRTVTSTLDRYDILASSSALFEFVDHLSNWYVRASRNRFWASGLGQDKLSAYWTLYECLTTLARLMAPFTPFFAEEMYRNLVAEPWAGKQPESVHLTAYPECDSSLVDEHLARRMALVLEVVSLGRAARVEAGLRVRQPLHEAILVLADHSVEKSLSDLVPLVQDELNVKQVRFADDADRYVVYNLKPNFKLIGPRLGPLVQKPKKALAEADAAGLRENLMQQGSCDVDVDGTRVSLSREEVEVGLSPRDGYLARAGRGVVLVLETQITEDLAEEWWAREVVAAVNGLRGDRSLAYEARIRLDVWCSNRLRQALEKNVEYLKGETLATGVTYHDAAEEGGEREGAAGDEKFRVDLSLE